MHIKQVLLKSLDESQEYLTKALKELTKEDIAWTPKVGSNSIIFIFWHLVRVEDIWISRILPNSKEIYESEGWQELLGTPIKESGFQYDLEKLQSWPIPSIDILQRYATVVRHKTVAFISSLDITDLSRVANPGHKYDTVEAIISHLITEIALHIGQIDYIRGLIRGLQF
ncbi:DinB family protein [Chloroflexota bacterium]